MITHVDETIKGKVIEVRLSGKLTSEDYAQFVPDSEALICEHGKIRILAILDDFHGWSASALWEDIKWDAHHFDHIERVAVVGEKRWHRWMARFCQPFTSATVQYFEQEQLPEARRWIEGE